MGKRESKTYAGMIVLFEEQRQEDLDVIRWIRAMDMYIKLQCDGGANVSCTPHKHILQHVETIPDYHIGGIGKYMKCTNWGIFYMQCRGGDVIPVKMYFSPEAKETIVLPTDTVTSPLDKFDSWQQTGNVTDGTGSIQFFSET